ncbi:MAG: hypothetical protein GWO02_00650 [Gammaproteobacteria bacterium]|nr:hypothetical protein [Gammaproteobacteria bacterium]
MATTSKGNPDRSARPAWARAAAAGVLALAASLSAGAQEDSRYEYEDEHLRMRLAPRTPDQIAAFYEARGFPDRAIEHLRRTCFITAVIRNKSDRIVWLALDDWRPRGPDGALERRDRDYWHRTWERLDLAQAHRSTFGWTLLPERRDLHPSEPVGGNLTLAPAGAPFTLEAHFATGEQRRGTPIGVRFEGVRCAGTDADR